MLRTTVSVLLGFVTGFAVVSAFELVNSRLFPFPPGMDLFDAAQVRAFAASLPLRALVLVLLGWIAGSLAAGFVASRLAGQRGRQAAIAIGIVLTAGAAFNAWLIRNPLWFHLGGLLLFLPLALAGHRLALSRQQRDKS